MIELTEQHFSDLCGSPAVREPLVALETQRSTGLRQFWTRLAGTLLLAVLSAFATSQAGYGDLSIIVFVAVAAGGFIYAYRPLQSASDALKHPALETLAQQAGMTYHASDFEPPVYPAAERALFGKWLSSRSFTDLFHGTTSDGKRFAFYEATLMQGSGKHQTQVFSGQVYAFECNRSAPGETVIVPDRGLFNFFKPGAGMERVPVEADAAFEKKFEVYSTEPMTARLLVADADLRRELLALRDAGKVFVYLGGGEALVAATGKNLFEPGSMFKNRGGTDRARLMFDDVCRVLGTCRRLKQVIG